MSYGVNLKGLLLDPMQSSPDIATEGKKEEKKVKKKKKGWFW